MTEVADGDRSTVDRSRDRTLRPTSGQTFRVLLYAWVAALAAFPLNDNSFLTHLATGRLILDEGAVPAADPYSFTAAGETWTVQSWLASVLYAAAERLAGGLGLKLLVLLVFLLAADLLWRVTAPAASVWARVLVVVPSLFVAYGLWSARPYMMSVVGLAVVWLALRGRISAWWLAPLFWAWANMHGAYPLAVALIVSVMAGRHLDRQPARRAVAVLGWTFVGILAAPIGPLGLRVLTFPLSSFGRSDVFADIIEWQSPNFTSVSERAFLVVIAVAVIAVTRTPRWEFIVPVVVFVPAALVAQRNIVTSTIVLAAVSACCLRDATGSSLDERRSLAGAYGSVGVAALLAAVIAVVVAPVTTLGGYPRLAIAWVDRTPVVQSDDRMATQALTGNLLTVLDGPQSDVFIDDRVDMYPRRVFADARVLIRGEPGWASVLDRHAIDVVVWDRELPLGALTALSAEWQIVFSDTEWMVASRRPGNRDR